MKILSVEPIEWICGQPPSFPCFGCHAEEATQKATAQEGVMELNLCLGDQCLSRISNGQIPPKLTRFVTGARARGAINIGA